ncbi:MAG: acetylxylan esterase [Bryobacteraceae bacterium]|nr:acetylxylan esterase [Bryobacteraceae bacterium]
MNRIALVFLLCSAAYSQALPKMGSGLEPPAEMLRGFLLGLADEHLAARRAAIAELKTPEQIAARQEYVRSTFLKMLGGLPDERGPLNLRRTGTLDRGDYRIDKIVFESLPNFFVTANLYVPKTGSPPYPAVLQPLGHSENGKAAAGYQSLGVGLAKNGFVVLAYDPIGQGERTIFYHEAIRGSLVGSSTREHQMVGIQSLLAGQSVARYRVWDGVRAIDALESLPEVDRERIGIAGCSGGGTLTTYLLALDQRIKVAAPACYISAWEEQIRGTGPQDAEQQFPGQLEAGINHGDFLIAFAPKPLLICSTTDDFFPIEGSTRTLVEMKRIYEALGAPGKVDRYVGPGGHGMRQDTREAIYSWMNHWLRGAPRQPVAEPAHKVEYDEDLYATATGKVATSLGGETASTWNIKSFAGIRPAALPAAELREAVTKLTRYQKPAGALNIRSQSRSTGVGKEIEYLVYDSEPGRYAPALLCLPSSGSGAKQAILYVDQGGKEAGFASNGDARALCEAGHPVLAVDLAGLGETGSEKGGYSPEWFGGDNLTWMALMDGRTLTGLRMGDIVRGLDVLAERGLLGAGVLGVARGTAGVGLLHAAAIDSRLSGLLLDEPLVSWRAIAETPVHRRIFDAVVPGVLGVYDLADLAAAIAPRPVSLLNVRSPLGDRLLLAEARKPYETASRAYRAANAEGAFRVGLRRFGEPLAQTLPGR